MSVLHCPRCDKRITPDHRCLNRRHFFGMLAGAAALLAAPKPALLRAGDRLHLTFIADIENVARSITGVHPAIWGATVRFDRTGHTKFVTGSYDHGPLFVVTEPCTITDTKLLVGNTIHRVPIEIKRSGQ